MDISGIDLFAGAGGFSLAAQKAGVQIKAAIEIDRHACLTYRKNFIEGVSEPPHLEEGDIGTISWPEFFRAAKISSGDCDLVIGGPPCQGFSAHRINDAGVDDPRNSLLFTYFESIQKIKPRAFVVENVAGLLWARHKEYLDRFLLLADQAGYRILGPSLLNARDFGVPQNRKRVFIVGILKESNIDVEWPPAPTHFEPGSPEVISGGKPSWKVARDIFTRPIRIGDPNDSHMQSGEKLVAIFRSTPLNGGSRSQSSRVLSCHKLHNGHKDVYGRIDPVRPGPTMTTACINPSKGRFLHPTEHHGIAVRHAARFQTFPDKFQFCGGLIASGKQIGNAVPIELGKSVIDVVMKGLRAYHSKPKVAR